MGVWVGLNLGKRKTENEPTEWIGLRVKKIQDNFYEMAWNRILMLSCVVLSYLVISCEIMSYYEHLDSLNRSEYRSKYPHIFCSVPNSKTNKLIKDRKDARVPVYGTFNYQYPKYILSQLPSSK